MLKKAGVKPAFFVVVMKEKIFPTVVCLLSLYGVANAAPSGGATTVSASGRQAFSLPAANLTPLQRLDFSVGNSFFRNPWVIAPSSTTARDGLGPLFNTNGCQNCHIKDGRGHPREAGEANAVSMLVRLSVTGTADPERLKREGVIPHPVYGGQLQDMAIPGIPAEAEIFIDYQDKAVRFADGGILLLRKPHLRLENFGYGVPGSNLLTSVRIAPQMIGLGLLEAIPEADILAEQQRQAKQGLVSGRANQVWDIARQQTVIGRFGWKAGQPTLMQQNSAAFSGDMGLTSHLFHQTDCTPAQQACLAAPDGGDQEVSDNILSKVEFYTAHLGVPARRNTSDPVVQQGEKLFAEMGCAWCHKPQQRTASIADASLANQVFYPYSDLLLHDMGEDLADHRPEFEASGSEWRTPPLWGLGLVDEVAGGKAFFLHDGRARSIEEAILWHGGEAQTAQNNYLKADRDSRQSLLKFLESL
ncbi:di-heme oxidoredictase family protein [Gynuella sunshinyii]|uniref:Putative thiol oxidoreductase n=1 Tax=Gynuella sunshinyii YC6258 TaxID=1445510 RepID=A0A0C5VBN6_9GAMM|nr:di-heme oxidoredictase family protein [Gynuella sunshinyii]AJQ96735.1 putative thiol oxidoreductase [Gynuella sunshinyii YC6258]